MQGLVRISSLFSRRLSIQLKATSGDVSMMAPSSGRSQALRSAALRVAPSVTSQTDLHNVAASDAPGRTDVEESDTAKSLQKDHASRSATPKSGATACGDGKQC
jgi:hypothetical protein